MEDEMHFFPDFPIQYPPRENNDSVSHSQSNYTPKKQKKAKTRRGGFYKKPEEETKNDLFTSLYHENKKKMLVNTFMRKLKQLRIPHE